MPPKIKIGEGTVVIIDVSRTTEFPNFFEQSKDCLIHILQRKIFLEKCQDLVGVVLMGSHRFDNISAVDSPYNSVKVLQNPCKVDWDMIKKCSEIEQGNSTADWLDSIIMAMDLLHESKGINYTALNIVLMTDFTGDFSDDKSGVIVNNMKDMKINLTLIGPDLNSSTMCKGVRQLASEALMKNIILEVDGTNCSFEEAIPQLTLYHQKLSGSANWNAVLDIGSLKIPVTGKIEIRHNTIPSWRKLVAKDENLYIHRLKSYHLRDENFTEIDANDVIKAYKFGTTLVPFPSSKLHYRSGAEEAMLSVVGFTKTQNVPLNLRSGDQVLYINARKYNKEAAIALSAIIGALNERESVAITRRIYRKGAKPHMGYMFPKVTPEYECLIWIALPYSEHVKDLKLPSLEKQKQKITREQNDAVDALINSMDLESEEINTSGFDPFDLLDPKRQRFYDCMTQRALNPNEKLTPPAKHILDILNVTEGIKQSRDEILPSLKEIFPTEKNEKFRKKQKIDFDEIEKELQQIKDKKITRIRIESPGDDFLTMLSDDQPDYYGVCKQMSEVLHALLASYTMNDVKSTTAIQNGITVYRKEAVNIDPKPYNEFIREFKKRVEIKGIECFWRYIVMENLGLIARNETLKSNVSTDEAEIFCKSFMNQSPLSNENNTANQSVDLDFMLDDF